MRNLITICSLVVFLFASSSLIETAKAEEGGFKGHNIANHDTADAKDADAKDADAKDADDADDAPEEDDAPAGQEE